MRASTQTFVPLSLPLDELRLQDYRIERIAACWETSYVVFSHHERGDVLVSMGTDDFGDLGIGGTSKDKPADRIHKVEFSQDVLGPNKPSCVRVLSFATGAHHIIVQLSLEFRDRPAHHQLVGWGTSRHGQLGDLKNPQTGRPLPYANSPRLVPLPLADPIIDLALGNQHSVFLSQSGWAVALGSNRRGQLNGIDHLQNLSAIGCTWNSTYTVTQCGDTWCITSSGAAHKGQLGRRIAGADANTDVHADGHPPRPVDFPFSSDTHEFVKIACGSEHVLCLFSLRVAAPHGTTQREVWAWGWNEHGTLGNGTTEDQRLPIKVWPPVDGRSATAIDVAAGCGNSWIVLES